MSRNSNRSIVVWLLSGCMLIAAMVIIGGITRLTHSGLSMVEWKLIMGSIPPLNEEQWQDTFDKYKQFPEYKVMHHYFTLQDFKSIFMWEYVHRLLGRLIGLVFVIPFVIFWINKRINKKLMRQLILIFVWGGFQGFLGWYMVKSGLVNDPNVSHYRLAVHLLTAFGLCCYIYWVALGLMSRKESDEVQKQKDLKKYKNWGVMLLVLTILQVTYGAFVAGLKAGFIHTTWPKMSGNWMDPTISTALSERGIEALVGDPVTIQFIHRWVAMAVLALVVFIVLNLKKTELNNYQRKAKSILTMAVLAQVILGILTLVLVVPVALAVAHQLFALILLLTIVYYLFHFSKNLKVN